MTGDFQARKIFVKLKRGERTRVVLLYSVYMVEVQSKNRDN